MDDVLLGKASIIERCLKRIDEEYRGHESELAANFTRQDAIVLNLQRACEASIDAAMHLVRLGRLGIPSDSRDAFQLLIRAGMLPESLGKRLMAMVGFRNIAVHNYQEIDVAILCEIVESRLDDLQQFAALLVGRAFPAQRGFTMIELVVTIIILGIVSAVVMPRFASLGAFDAKGYGDQVQALLRYAHKTAIAQRAMVLADVSTPKLCVKTSGTTCDTTSCADLPLPGGAWKAPIASTTVTGGTLFCFDSMGRPYASGASSAMTATATVQVNDSGASVRSIRIEAETGYVH